MPAEAAELVSRLRRHLADAPVDAAPGYTLWNGYEPESPAASVECRSAEDVATAVRIAGDHGTSVTVRAGGHAVHGGGRQRNHLVVDLRRMNDVSIRDGGESVVIGGGTKAAGLLDALPDGVAAVTGTVRSIGMVGLSTGGGYGLLNGRYGLACDSIRSAELVLADGTRAIASPEQDAELLWALRGGGTGFGVVTALKLQTHALPSVLRVLVAVPLESAVEALLAIQDIVLAEPEQAGIIPILTGGPDGTVGLLASALWHGESTVGDRALAPLTSVAGATVLEHKRIAYRASLDPDELWPRDRLWFGNTATVSRIDEPVAERVVEAARHMPVGEGSAIFLHDLHGAPTRVEPDASAFPLRSAHFVCAIVGSWKAEEPAQEQARKAWVDESLAALEPFSIPGGYVNFLPPEPSTRVRQFYGSAASRLLATRKRVDPHELFSAVIGRFR